MSGFLIWRGKFCPGILSQSEVPDINRNYAQQSEFTLLHFQSQERRC